MKTFTKTIAFAIIATIVATLIGIAPVKVTAATKATPVVTVTNKKDFLNEVSKKAAATIILESEKSFTLTIKANTKAKNKKIIIDAPKAKVKNYAKFKTITVKNAKTYSERVNSNKITVNSEKTAFSVYKNITVKKLTIPTAAQVKLGKKAKITTIKYTKKSGNVTTTPTTTPVVTDVPTTIPAPVVTDVPTPVVTPAPTKTPVILTPTPEVTVTETPTTTVTATPTATPVATVDESGNPIEYLYGNTIWKNLNTGDIWWDNGTCSQNFGTNAWVDTVNGKVYPTWSYNGKTYIITDMYDFDIELIDGVPQWPTATSEPTKAPTNGPKILIPETTPEVTPTQAVVTTTPVVTESAAPTQVEEEKVNVTVTPTESVSPTSVETITIPGTDAVMYVPTKEDTTTTSTETAHTHQWTWQPCNCTIQHIAVYSSTTAEWCNSNSGCRENFYNIIDNEDGTQSVEHWTEDQINAHIEQHIANNESGNTMFGPVNYITTAAYTENINMPWKVCSICNEICNDTSFKIDSEGSYILSATLIN